MIWQIHVFFYCLLAFFQAYLLIQTRGPLLFSLFLMFFFVAVFFKDKFYVSYRAVSYRAVSLIWTITRQSCSNMRMWHQTDGASLPHSTDTTISADAYRKRFHFPLCGFYYCYFSVLKCIFNEYILWTNVM